MKIDYDADRIFKHFGDLFEEVFKKPMSSDDKDIIKALHDLSNSWESIAEVSQNKEAFRLCAAELNAVLNRFVK